MTRDSEAYKKCSQALMGELLFYTTQYKIPKRIYGPLQTQAGKEQNPFDWHRDKLLLKELPAHAGNFLCHVPCD